MPAASRAVRIGSAVLALAGAVVLGVSGAARAATASPLLAATPWMGWNTWYSFGGTYDEATIHRVAHGLISEGFAAEGYRVVWLDAGWWQGARNANGSIKVDPAQWPNGMKGLATYVHRLGLEAGIYTDAGRTGCGEANAGSDGHIQRDMNSFAAWGFDAVKIDFCGGNVLHLRPATIYAAYARAIGRNSSHRKMIFEICDAFPPINAWRFGPAIAQGWRTGHDIAFGNYDPAWSGLLSLRIGEFGSVLDNLDLDAAHPRSAGPGHWNDPDYLQAGVPTLTPTEQRSQFSMWSMLSAPLVIGRDPTTFSSQTRAMLRNAEVIAVDQDPRGSQAVMISDHHGLQVWSKRLQRSGARAVALFNRSPMPSPITVDWSALGLRGPVRVRGLWQHRNLGTFATKFTEVVPSHATVLLSVRAAEGSLRRGSRG